MWRGNCIFREWHSESKTTATAIAGCINNIAAVRAGDLPRQSQAEAGTLNAAAQRIVGAIKLLENLFLRTTRHAEAAITHRQFRKGLSIFLPREDDRDFL